MIERPPQGSLQWLAERRTGLGGSEISTLYRRPDGTCAHPWLSQTELWGLKTGRIPDDQPTPREAPHLYVGRVLERPVREMYETFSGRTVADGVTLERDAIAPVLIASTDGEQRCPSRPDEPAIYEGKVTTIFRRKDWIVREESPTGDAITREVVPLHYRCQTQHYMACTGLTWSSVVAFIQADQAPIHWRDIDRHDAFIDDMRERASRWWRDHVEADVAPPVDDAESTEAALRRIHREAEDLVVQLPAAFAAALDRLDAIADLGAMLKRERQGLRNLILAALGPATLGVIAADGRGWSLRGVSGRVLRSLTAAGIERARRGAMSKPVYVPPEVGRRLDELYRLSARAFTDQPLSAKAIHVAHLAALAAQSQME